MSRASFIAQVAPYAVEEMARTVLIGKPVLASYTIAQACLESADGKSPINGNYFGVKGSGDSYETTEYDANGNPYTVVASFATYGSMEASVIGHSQFLIQNGRYTRYGVFAAGEKRDWRTACQALEDAGYGTDPQYAELLISIIEANNLQQYDKEVDDMLAAITQLQEQVQTLLNTAEAHVTRISELEGKMSMDVPSWAKEAVSVALSAGLIDTPDGGSYDFYRLVTILHRKKLI